MKLEQRIYCIEGVWDYGAREVEPSVEPVLEMLGRQGQWGYVRRDSSGTARAIRPRKEPARSCNPSASSTSHQSRRPCLRSWPMRSVNTSIDGTSSRREAAGDRQVTIRVGDVHSAMSLDRRLPAVAGPLDTDLFRLRSHAELIGERRPRRESETDI